MPDEAFFKKMDRELDEAEAKAKRLGMTFFVYKGDMYVYDGGKRSHWGDDWSRGLRCTSCRRASDEEQELWDLLP